jgi:hypothetical protein
MADKPSFQWRPLLLGGVAVAVFCLVATAFTALSVLVASTLHSHDTGVIISLVIGAVGGVAGYVAAWVVVDRLSDD